MKKITLSALACSLILAGCGKDNSSNNDKTQEVNQQNQTAKTVDLSNKTTAEVLALKYDKAVLTCSLWSQRGIRSPPNAIYEYWDKYSYNWDKTCPNT